MWSIRVRPRRALTGVSFPASLRADGSGRSRRWRVGCLDYVARRVVQRATGPHDVTVRVGNEGDEGRSDAVGLEIELRTGCETKQLMACKGKEASQPGGRNQGSHDRWRPGPRSVGALLIEHAGGVHLPFPSLIQTPRHGPSLAQRRTRVKRRNRQAVLSSRCPRYASPSLRAWSTWQSRRDRLCRTEEAAQGDLICLSAASIRLSSVTAARGSAVADVRSSRHSRRSGASDLRSECR